MTLTPTPKAGRGTHRGLVAHMSGEQARRAGRLSAAMQMAAAHAVTPDDTAGGLALGQQTLVKERGKQLVASAARLKAARPKTTQLS